MTGKNLRLLIVPQNRKDLIAITELCGTGKIVPVIDRRYPFNETPQALRYVAEGRAKGKVVITVV
jgi:NADPH:quinone reductase-like Zn-dependent oxidoreductase